MGGRTVCADPVDGWSPGRCDYLVSHRSRRSPTGAAPVTSARGISALTGVVAESPCVADQSVPTHSRSDGTGTSLGSGTGNPGTDGMVSDGGDTRLDRPVAASGVSGLGGAGTPTLTDPAPPGTGGVPGGAMLITDEAVFCTVRATPGGVSRSEIVSVLPGVPGIGDPGVPVLTPAEFGGVGGTGGAG